LEAGAKAQDDTLFENAIAFTYTWKKYNLLLKKFKQTIFKVLLFRKLEMTG
jgi:hypothetical protein